ncbi:MAG: ATP-dependent sacrificial sulfur transferase LarE [Thermoplasmata archaeon]
MMPGVPSAFPTPDEISVLVARIRAGGRALVALSGGVDSAVVAALARRALGDDCLAVTLVGPAVSQAEREGAEHSAHEIGITHEVVAVDPLTSPDYRANPDNRCYFCRVVETSALRDRGQRQGVRQYLDGIHLDDIGDDRPGIRAMNEAGFVHPLLEAGWRKSDVRAFAHDLSLSSSSRPSDACLASRVRHGIPITVALLQQVDAAERSVRSMGFRRVRVRVDGTNARVEVDPTEVPRLLSEPTAGRVEESLRGLGFTGTLLDPTGYRARPGM